MNEVQSAKITIEIDRLMAEAKKLEAKADSDDEMFADAWREYGSELAGPPSSIKVNRNKAKELRRKADFLTRIQKGENFKTIDELKANIDLVEKQIEALMSSKGAMYGEISLLQYLESVVK